MIAWYLDEIGNEIETEDELIEQKQVIEKVVDKLIYQDQVFLMTLSIVYFLANSWFDCCRVLYAHVKNFTKICQPQMYSGYCAFGKHCKGITWRRPLPCRPPQLLLLRCLICTHYQSIFSLSLGYCPLDFLMNVHSIATEISQSIYTQPAQNSKWSKPVISSYTFYIKVDNMLFHLCILSVPILQ